MAKTKRRWIDLSFASSDCLRLQDIPYDVTYNAKTILDNKLDLTSSIGNFTQDTYLQVNGANKIRLYPNSVELHYQGSGGIAFKYNGTNVQSWSSTGTTITGTLDVTGAATAASFSGSGTGLTALSGTNITSGTVGDTYLSSNIPRLDAANTFGSASTTTFIKNATGYQTVASFQNNTVGGHALMQVKGHTWAGFIFNQGGADTFAFTAYSGALQYYGHASGGAIMNLYSTTGQRGVWFSSTGTGTNSLFKFEKTNTVANQTHTEIYGVGTASGNLNKRLLTINSAGSRHIYLGVDTYSEGHISTSQGRLKFSVGETLHGQMQLATTGLTVVGSMTSDTVVVSGLTTFNGTQMLINQFGRGTINFGQHANGVNPPGTNAAGVKLKLYGATGDYTLTAGEYAIGVESSNMWFTTGFGYKWYGSTSLTVTSMTLQGNNLTVTGNVTVGGTITGKTAIRTATQFSENLLTSDGHVVLDCDVVVDYIIGVLPNASTSTGTVITVTGIDSSGGLYGAIVQSSDGIQTIWRNGTSASSTDITNQTSTFTSDGTRWIAT